MSLFNWLDMVPPRVQQIRLEHYDIPLPQVLSDSTHGRIASFGLNTARVTTEEGLEGLGYSYVVGNIGGSAIHSLLRDNLAPFLRNTDPVAINTLWYQMWWYVHFVGRGGLASFALATLDIALWDLLGKAAQLPWYQLLGGSRRPIAVYAGGIDLQLTLAELLQQTDCFLEQGFEAIKMKVGRSNLDEDAARVAAHAKSSWGRLSPDGGCQHAVGTRRSHLGGPGFGSFERLLVGRTSHPGCVRRACPHCQRRWSSP